MLRLRFIAAFSASVLALLPLAAGAQDDYATKAWVTNGTKHCIEVLFRPAGGGYHNTLWVHSNDGKETQLSAGRVERLNVTAYTLKSDCRTKLGTSCGASGIGGGRWIRYGTYWLKFESAGNSCKLVQRHW